MSNREFSVELVGQKLFLNLKKAPDDDLLVQKLLNKRDRPELTGLECEFAPDDLENLKETRDR